MDFFIYILYSISIDRFYTGQSNDPYRRLEEHNSGKLHKSTTTGRPWELRAIFLVRGTRSEAMKMEKFIKNQKSRKLIEKLIDPAFTPTGTLAKLARVPHVRD